MLIFAKTDFHLPDAYKTVTLPATSRDGMGGIQLVITVETMGWCWHYRCLYPPVDTVFLPCPAYQAAMARKSQCSNRLFVYSLVHKHSFHYCRTNIFCLVMEHTERYRGKGVWGWQIQSDNTLWNIYDEYWQHTDWRTLWSIPPWSVLWLSLRHWYQQTEQLFSHRRIP